MNISYRYFLIKKKVEDTFNIVRCVNNWKQVLIFKLGIGSLHEIKFRDMDKLSINNDLTFIKELLLIAKIKRQLGNFKIKHNSDFLFQIIVADNIKFICDREYLMDTLKLIIEQYIEDLYRLEGVMLDGNTVIDIGANLGDAALLFASRGSNVIAFEPVRITFGRLLKNIEENNFGEKIKVFNVGLSDCNKVIQIEIDPSNTIGFSFEFENKNKTNKLNSEIVELVDGFNFLSKNGINKCDILKIDCEGCENALFRDSRLINLLRPEKIIMEYHHGNDNALIKVLSKHYLRIEKKEFSSPKGFGMIYADQWMS